MKRSIAFLIILINGLTVNSQESYIDSVLSEVMFYDDNELLYMDIEEDKTYHFIYANATYSNKTFYAGREVANPQYYLASQVSYFNSNGFFMGLGISSGTWFASNGDASYNNAIILGYGKALNKHKWLRYNLSYSRFFGISEGLDFSSTYANNAHLGIGLKHKWFGARAGLNFLFGSASKATFSWNIYSQLTLWNLGQFNNIKLEPQLSFFYDSEEVMADNQNWDEINYNNEFGWMNTELNLPLIINLNDFDIELAYTINLPRSLDPNYAYDTTSFFTISVGYIFEL